MTIWFCVDFRRGCLVKVTVVDSITVKTVMLNLGCAGLILFFYILFFVRLSHERIADFCPWKRVNRSSPVQQRVMTSLESEN